MNIVDNSNNYGIGSFYFNAAEPAVLKDLNGLFEQLFLWAENIKNNFFSLDAYDLTDILHGRDESRPYTAH